jgi:hypothetical protein
VVFRIDFFSHVCKKDFCSNKATANTEHSPDPNQQAEIQYCSAKRFADKEASEDPSVIISGSIHQATFPLTT